jgi:signal transduction histidine kinase
MLRVFDCLTKEHDPGLVVLAVLIACVASTTTFGLFSHAATETGRARAGWLAATAAVTGGGIWATHFIAMLAYAPRVPFGYDVFETILSILVAIGVSGAGFAVASFAPSRRSSFVWLGGATVGLGIAAMHYTGMAAIRIPGILVYDTKLVVASVALGAFFGAVALWRFRPDGGLGNCLECGLALVSGIGLMHFTGMGALSVEQAPMVVVMDNSLPAEWLAVAVAVAVLAIACVALAASAVDRRMAFRSQLEAERLRRAVSELERTKAQLEATGANLQEALSAAAAGSQAKSQFLATMSHELRTPLNAVIGFSEVMSAELYGPMTDKQRDCIDDIRRAGVHLLALVNDVLDVSRLEAEAVQLDEEDIDIGLVVGDAIRLNIGRAEENGVTIASELPPVLPVLHADARRVRQIVVNLLSNAVKFTLAGGEVTVAVRRVRDGLQLSVRDTGIGMAADEIPIALARFGQVDNRLARKFDGTGLGLPLSKRLAELHGGSLSVESVQNAGTTVTVIFPNDRLRELSAAA